jgi:simple sugar transport system ATP-binding protein
VTAPTLPEQPADPVVALRDVSMRFGGMQALNGVTMDVFPGEVVSLVGDNGAGKSTLTKVITGVHTPTSGSLLLSGSPVRRWNTHRARAEGIETVFQDQALVPQQTIAENIFLGREPVNALGFMRTRFMRTEANDLMRRLGFTSRVFNARSTIGNLSGGERQGVAIARALYFQARLIIMDEPTTALSLTETEEVLGFIRRMRADGRSILFISHNIYHSHDVADRIVVLDRGRILQVLRKDELSAEDLIELMHAANRTSRMERQR